MERTFFFTVSPEYDGARLEVFLMHGHGFSRRVIRALKQRPDDILRNGERIRMVDPVHCGDTVRTVFRDEKPTSAACSFDVPVVYEDDDLIIYNKPPFCATHPSKLHQSDTLANVYAASHQNGTFRPVFRLDRDTDGLCICAKNTLAAAGLAGKVEKTYTAVAEGFLPENSGVIAAPLVQLEPHKMRRGVRRDGQTAITYYTVLRRTSRYTLLSLTLPTGRTHQIRAHFAHIGHPLVGDTMYGKAHPTCKRQALSCTEVRFIHPITRKSMNIHIDMHADLQTLLLHE